MKKITLFILSIFVLLSIILIGINLFTLDATSVIKTDFVIRQPEFSLTTPTKRVNKMGGIMLSEVALHNTKNDCYLIVNSDVYDVTSYLNLHPGGSQIIVNACGKEVSKIFARIHSNRAWNLLSKYKVGSLMMGVGEIQNIKMTLDQIDEGLQNSNKDAQIVSVKPNKTGFIAKVLLKGSLYEVHLDSLGTIVKEEIESDELDWNEWNNDKDDK